MYGRATRSSITVVSKFPTKTWGAAHARTVDTRRSSPQLPRAPGNEAKQVMTFAAGESTLRVTTLVLGECHSNINTVNLSLSN